MTGGPVEITTRVWDRAIAVKIRIMPTGVYWELPPARELRKIAAGAARDAGRTLTPGAHRVEHHVYDVRYWLFSYATEPTNQRNQP